MSIELSTPSGADARRFFLEQQAQIHGVVDSLLAAAK
jgi:hypothetical protein